jgi:hypothetical protein
MDISPAGTDESSLDYALIRKQMKTNVKEVQDEVDQLKDQNRLLWG